MLHWHTCRVCASPRLHKPPACTSTVTGQPHAYRLPVATPSTSSACCCECPQCVQTSADTADATNLKYRSAIHDDDLSIARSQLPLGTLRVMRCPYLPISSNILHYPPVSSSILRTMEPQAKKLKQPNRLACVATKSNCLHLYKGGAGRVTAGMEGTARCTYCGKWGHEDCVFIHLSLCADRPLDHPSRRRPQEPAGASHALAAWSPIWHCMPE
jgi:hypothetical protein